MSTKHTPGPRSANFTRLSGVAIGFHITDKKHGSLRPICEAYDKTGAMDPDEIEANARLIAAAPELLMALRLASPALEYLRKQFPRSEHDDSIDALAITKSAIAKATGEQQ